MDNNELLKQLKNLRKKWRASRTKEDKMAAALFSKGAAASAEKSVGISIGFGSCAYDIDKLIRILSKDLTTKTSGVL